MRMQKAARDVAVVKRFVNGVARHDQRQRQIAPADPLGQAQEIRPDGGLFASEKSTCSAAAHRDFVSDQVDLITVAQAAHGLKVGCVVHGHAARALHQRLDDDRGDVAGAALQQVFQFGGGPQRHRNRRFTRLGLSRIRAGHHMDILQKRAVGRPEQRHIGHRQRAQRFTVIAVLEADELTLVGLPCIAPGMDAHLQGDLDRRRAVGRIETVAQHVVGQGRQLLRQPHDGLMREAGQHGVFEPVELVFQCRVDARIGMPEQIDPPRTDGVQITPPVGVVQPGPAAVADRHQRHGFMVLHLGAGVPHAVAAASHPVVRAAVSVFAQLQLTPCCYERRAGRHGPASVPGASFVRRRRACRKPPAGSGAWGCPACRGPA